MSNTIHPHAPTDLPGLVARTRHHEVRRERRIVTHRRARMLARADERELDTELAERQENERRIMRARRAADAWFAAELHALLVEVYSPYHPPLRRALTIPEYTYVPDSWDLGMAWDLSDAEHEDLAYKYECYVPEPA